MFLRVKEANTVPLGRRDPKVSIFKERELINSFFIMASFQTLFK